MITVLPPMFAGLDDDDQMQARRMLQPVRFGPGEVVMKVGDDDTSLAFVMSGSLEIVHDETRIGVTGARDLLGEMELFTGNTRLATAKALSPVDLLVLDPGDYVELCETGNALVSRLEQHALRRVGDRLRDLDERITNLSDGEPFELRPTSPGLFARLNPFKRSGTPSLDITAVLSQSELFGWAPASLLDELANHFETASYRNDERICSQGEPGETLFIIASGQVDIVLLVAENRAEQVATLGAGRAFGDSSIVHGCPRTATCVSRGDVQVLKMDRDDFSALVDVDTPESSVFRQGLIRNLVMQVDRATQRFELLDQNRKVDQEEMYKGTPVSAVWRD